MEMAVLPRRARNVERMEATVVENDDDGDDDDDDDRDIDDDDDVIGLNVMMSR